MSDEFQVTVRDLKTGDVQMMTVAVGDYVVIPFLPCRLTHTQRSANGTVRLTLKDHQPDRGTA